MVGAIEPAVIEAFGEIPEFAMPARQRTRLAPSVQTVLHKTTAIWIDRLGWQWIDAPRRVVGDDLDMDVVHPDFVRTVIQPLIRVERRSVAVEMGE